MTERVISSKTLGSSNPIAKKFRSIKSAFGGIGFGIILLFLALFLIYQSVFGVKEYSKIVESLPVKKAAEVTANEGLVKIQDTVSESVPVGFTFGKCLDRYCAPGKVNDEKVANLFNYSFSKERFEIVKHVRTETRTTEFAGQETEEQVEVTEYKEEWVGKEAKTETGKFKLGVIEVVPATVAKIMIDPIAQTVPNVAIPNLQPMEFYGQVPGAEVGTTKIDIKAIPLLDGKQVIVVGEVKDSKIIAGDPFIVTMKSEKELLESLKTEESFQRVALLVGSWLSIFIGISLVLAPILELINWIPLFGKAAKFAAAAIGFVTATVITLSGYFLLKYWYLLLICFVVLIVLAIVLVLKTSKKPTVAA